MALIARVLGLLVCLQAAAGLAGALGPEPWRAAGRLSVVDRLPWLADYAVFANMSLLVAGIAVVVAASRVRGGGSR